MGGRDKDEATASIYCGTLAMVAPEKAVRNAQNYAWFATTWLPGASRLTYQTGDFKGFKDGDVIALKAHDNAYVGNYWSPGGNYFAASNLEYKEIDAKLRVNFADKDDTKIYLQRVSDGTYLSEDGEGYIRPIEGRSDSAMFSGAEVIGYSGAKYLVLRGASGRFCGQLDVDPHYLKTKFYEVDQWCLFTVVSPPSSALRVYLVQHKG